MSKPERRRPRRPLIVAAVLVAGLIGAMAIEPTRQLIAQRQRMSDVYQQLEATRADNDKLAQRIERLHDGDFIEQRAREQLGLVLPGETAIVVMPPSRAQKAKMKPKVAPSPTPPPPQDPSFLDGLLDFVGLGWL